MKKSARIAAVLLCVLLAVSVFSACSPMRRVEEAVQNTAELESFHAMLMMNIELEMLGVKIPLEMRSDIKAQDVDGTAHFTSTTTVEGMGVEESLLLAGDGEWFYYTSNGEALKARAENVTDRGQYAQIEEMLQDLPEDVYKDATVTKRENGERQVQISLDDEVFEQTRTFEGLLEEIKSAVGTQGSDTKELWIGTVDLSLLLSEEYLLEYALDFGLGMVMTIEGEDVEVTASVRLCLSFVDPGEPVSVTLPYGYEHFTEVSELP